MNAMKKKKVHILGGGPAGLTAGYYAKKHNLNFNIYEAGTVVGGNCRTIKLGDYRFDTGAHRFHDKDPVATAEVKRLLGDDLLSVDAPSEIFYNDKFYRFPLELTDLIDKLGYRNLLNIAWDKLCSSSIRKIENFEALALRRYGKTLAKQFLLNYSKKLWGIPTHHLSTAISGNRLKGLDIRSFFRSTLFGSPKKPGHLDGTFFYPKYGIGMIPEKLFAYIGKENVKLQHGVSRIMHKNGRIERIILNDAVEIQTGIVINTLPLTLSLRILEPPPPSALVSIADNIKYRHLILCVYCLKGNTFSQNASLYFPSEEFPFTRLYEPKNRSPYMAPEAKTVIVLEIPCFRDEKVWQQSDRDLNKTVWEMLCRVKSLKEEDIVHFQTFKLPFAYPVLEVGYEEDVKRIVDYFKRFENLYLTGRSSLFKYVHLHDLFKAGKEVVEQIVNEY